MNEELEYLRWIYQNMDFGPAHEDVMIYLDERYVEETGNPIPDGYKSEYEEE